MKIQRALISVFDKTGAIDLARYLAEAGIQILSTGGTAKLLLDSGIQVTEVSDYTASPEIFDGRVKTLHPKIHGGLLYIRDSEAHQKIAEEHGVLPIDLLIVNLYPFEEAIAKPETSQDEAIEMIDIGGPSMLRSAAKNHRFVTVVCDPKDYSELIETLKNNQGQTTSALREKLAIKVFSKTSAYDLAIANYLNASQTTGASFNLSLPLIGKLRYGENPHQQASLYGYFGECFRQLHGKDLSYNNILDITAAVDLIEEFSEPTVAILKHTNPCGVGSDDDLKKAWEKAYATDKQAPFGGIIVCNRTLTPELARCISEIFSEIIIAPDFEAEARAILQKKKNLRLMQKLKSPKELKSFQQDIRTVVGGVLVQDLDIRVRGLAEMETKVVTRRKPSVTEMQAMIFAWKVVKHVKSNAIVFAAHDRTLGIGAGQMSRIDSTRIAVKKAEEAELSLQGSAVASDGLFPFADGLLAAADAGAAGAIQPGGSIRDHEVIEAADARDIAMVMTGFRHFKH